MVSTSSGRVRFDHTAIAVSQKAPILDLLRELFGGTIAWDDKRGLEKQGFRAAQLDLAGTILEVIEPAGEASFLHPFLAKRGPGLHHLTFKVHELDRLFTDLETRGVGLTGIERDTHGRVVNGFTRPTGCFGVLVQFRPGEAWLKDALQHHPSREGLPPPLPARARLRATEIAVPDGPAALGFFQTMLGGEIGELTGQDGRFRQALSVGGTNLDFLWPAEPGAALHAIDLDVIAWSETLAAARRLGLPVREGDAHASIGPDNRAGARFVLHRGR